MSCEQKSNMEERRKRQIAERKRVIKDVEKWLLMQQSACSHLQRSMPARAKRPQFADSPRECDNGRNENVRAFCTRNDEDDNEDDAAVAAHAVAAAHTLVSSASGGPRVKNAPMHNRAHKRARNKHFIH
jgi:replicative DNA helicase